MVVDIMSERQQTIAFKKNTKLSVILTEHVTTVEYSKWPYGLLTGIKIFGIVKHCINFVIPN
jgi:hypothetical protein